MTSIHIKKLYSALDDIDIFTLLGWNGIKNDSSDEECYESNNTHGTQFDYSDSLSYY